MKRFSSLLLFFIIATACAFASEGETVTGSSSSEMPAWTKLKWCVTNTGKEDFIWITVSGEARDARGAEIMAEANMMRTYAMSIGYVVKVQYEFIRKDFTNNPSVVDGYYKKTVSIISRNIDASGLVKREKYWQTIKKDNAEFYRMYLNYSIPVKQYKKSMENYTKKARDEGDQSMKDNSDAILKSLDDSVKKLIGLQE